MMPVLNGFATAILCDRPAVEPCCGCQKELDQDIVILTSYFDPVTRETTKIQRVFHRICADRWFKQQVNVPAAQATDDELIAAAHLGDQSAVRLFSKSRNISLGGRMQALEEAAKRGHEAIVQYLWASMPQAES